MDLKLQHELFKLMWKTLTGRHTLSAGVGANGAPSEPVMPGAETAPRRDLLELEALPPRRYRDWSRLRESDYKGFDRTAYVRASMTAPSAGELDEDDSSEW